MYSTPSLSLKARVTHLCTNCGEPILIGETYKRWVTFDDCATTSKMHPECLKLLQGDGYGEFEYTLYGGERPHD